MRALLLSLAAALGPLVAPAPAGDAVRDLRAAFRPTRDVAEALPARRAALAAAREALRADGAADAKLGDALLLAAAQIDAEVREFERRRSDDLARGTNPADHERRLREIDPLHALDEELDAALAALPPGAAADAVVQAALEDSKLPARVRVRAARAAAAASERVAAAVGAAVARARRPIDRTAALAAAEALGPRAAPFLDVLARATAEDDPLHRRLAVRALAAVRAGRALPALVARLDDPRFAVRVEAAAALRALTGRTLGASRAAWEQWLAREGGPFVAGEAALPEGGTPTTAPRSTGPTYFGLPLEGDGVLFVVDRSLSMSRTMGKPSRKAEPGEMDRKRRAAEELCTALGALRPDQRFDVAAFANTSDRFRGELVPATEQNVALAQAWVREEGLVFGTGIYDALELAFLVAAFEREDALADTAVDSIYLLTDGRPVLPGGKNDDRDAIRRAARRWNVLRQVKVRVVGLGDDAPRKFLEGLAQDSGGEFVLRVAD